MQIARENGFSIYYIEFLLKRAGLHLLCGEPQPALDDLRVALEDGVYPSPRCLPPPIPTAAIAGV